MLENCERDQLPEVDLAAGSVRLSKVLFRPGLTVKGFALVEPKAAGGEQLFYADTCSMQSPLKGLLSGNNQ